MTAAEVYIEAARKIAAGEVVGVVHATGGMDNPYASKMLEYFGHDGCCWPWEVEEMPEHEADEMRVLALLFMAEIAADDAPVFH